MPKAVTPSLLNKFVEATGFYAMYSTNNEIGVVTGFGSVSFVHKDRATCYFPSKYFKSLLN